MRHIVFAVLCCSVAIVGAGPAAAAPLHPTGYPKEDLEKLAPDHEVRSVPVAPGAPCYRDVLTVDLSDELPPVGNQGGQGSCSSWSCAYYHRTQLEYKERLWDLTDPNHQFSPAFVYNQINGGLDGGSGFTNNFGLMVDQGCASLVDAPYDDGNLLGWPSESAYVHAMPFRCKEWAWSRILDDSAIVLIKQLLNNGFTTCVGVNVWGNFDAIQNYDYTYCVADRMGTLRGGHMVTVIGYNDTMPTNDGPGAFKLVNSWGTGWGLSGFFWMSYVALKDSLLSHRNVGWMTDTVGYVPKMLGRVRIDHPARDRFGIAALVGPREAPLWSHNFRTWRREKAQQPFPKTTIVFDMTGGADYIENLQTDSAFIACRDDTTDGNEGTLLYYSCQYLPWANTVPSHDTPMTIPDDRETIYACAQPGQWDPDVGVVQGPAPVAMLDSSQTAVPQVLVRNFGQGSASFPVEYRIGSNYCDTQQVTNLAPGDTTRLTFRSWTALDRNMLSTRCTTMLTGDQFLDNDWSEDSVFVRVRDVALLEITSPPDTVDSGAFVPPQVMVSNKGNQDEDLRAVFRIPDEGFVRGASKVFPAGAETLMTFPNWKPSTIGTHVACCTLFFESDVHPEDNAIEREVTVIPVAGIHENPELAAQEPHVAVVPNPFRTHADINLRLTANSPCGLAIYDASGRLVRYFSVPQSPVPNPQSLVWDGKNTQGKTAPAGVYYCRVEGDADCITARMLKLE